MPALFVGFASDEVVAGLGDSISAGRNTRADATADQDVVLLLDNLPTQPEAVNHWRVVVNKALTDGRRVVLVAGPTAVAGLIGHFGSWLANRLGLTFEQTVPLELQSSVPELDSYCRGNLGHLRVVDLSHAKGPVRVLATTSASPGVQDASSFRMSLDQAEVFLVPVTSAIDATGRVQMFLELVPPSDPYPEYLDDVEVDDEREVVRRIVIVRAELEVLEQQVAKARALKRILYLSGVELEVEVVRWLNEELNVLARHVSGNKEDMWLVDSQSQDWAVGEVKAPGRGNVSKADIGAAVMHRSEADLEDSYPTLLVVNTFCRAGSVSERDQPVHPEVSRRAAEDHVLIVRTLDLFRLRKGSPQDRQDFTEAVRSGGGWFEVDADGATRTDK